MAHKVEAAIDYPEILKDAQGMYVWLNLDEVSTNNLLRILRTAPFKTYDGTELHTTVIHSKILPDSLVAPADQEYSAVLEGFITWQDHKDRTIVVAALSSFELLELHDELVEQGLHHGYPEYNPHITVGKDVELTDETQKWLRGINKALESHEVIVKFSPQLRATPIA